jgi:hypothetical protein
MSEVKEAFKEPLKTEILKILTLDKYSKEERDHSYCAVVVSSKYLGESLEDTINRCNVIITFTLDIDTSKISGYTFLENELVICYLLSDSCNNFINKNNLIQFRDSIAGYSNKIHSNKIYDMPMRLFEVSDNDRMKLIKSYFVEDLE